MRYRQTSIPYPETDFPFRIDATSSRPEAIWSRPIHSHSDAIEIQYIHYGNGHYFAGGRFNALRPRTLCIIPPHTPHAYLKEDVSLVLKKTALIFSPALLRARGLEKPLARWLQPARDPGRQHLFLTEKQAARIEQLLSLLVQEWTGKAPFYRTAILGYLRPFLIEIERAWQEGGVAGGREGHALLMDRLLAHIDSAFARPLTLAGLAAQVQRSACHVSHVFKQAKGLTFTEYLAARRVMEARRLLETDDNRKIFAIALESGFASLSSFNRTFHRLVGMSPSRYRCLHNPRA